MTLRALAATVPSPLWSLFPPSQHPFPKEDHHGVGCLRGNLAKDTDGILPGGLQVGEKEPSHTRTHRCTQMPRLFRHGHRNPQTRQGQPLPPWFPRPLSLFRVAPLPVTLATAGSLNFFLGSGFCFKAHSTFQKELPQSQALPGTLANLQPTSEPHSGPEAPGRPRQDLLVFSLVATGTHFFGEFISRFCENTNYVVWVNSIPIANHKN